MNSRKMRYSVNVLRPPLATTLDSRGQLSGNPVTVARNVPCEVETLRGNELIQAHQQFPTATHRVTMYRNSRMPVNEEHWLTFQGRRLNIAGIDDLQENGRLLVLLCGEDKS